MQLYKMEIVPDEKMIPVALASVRTVAGYFFEDEPSLEHITLALEEAIANVTEYCLTDSLKSISIGVDMEDGSFIVTVTDKGLPGDLERELTGEKKIGLSIMYKLMDKVIVENLGAGGRRQRMVKYVTNKPDFDMRSPAGPVMAEEDVRLIIRPTREDEAIEVARCIYDEFGFTYINDTVYYPERFYAAVQSGDMYSLVAVSEDGEIAAHLSMWRWSIMRGIWEMGMGVVKRQFRNVHIMNRLSEAILAHARDEAGLDTLLCEPVLYHPYTQKISNKLGFHACGAGLSYMPVGFETTINNTPDKRNNVAVAMAVFKKEPHTLYVHPELCAFIKEIADRMELPVSFVTLELSASHEESVTLYEAYTSIRLGRIAVFESGVDAARTLHRLTAKLKRQGVDVIELFLRADEPGARATYEAAKELGFFCTGFLPLSGRGDMLMMENLLAQAVDYDALSTVEPFTEVLASIRTFDPNETQEGEEIS